MEWLSAYGKRLRQKRRYMTGGRAGVRVLKTKNTRHKNTSTDENKMENFRFVDESNFELVFPCSTENISWLCLRVVELDSENRKPLTAK